MRHPNIVHQTDARPGFIYLVSLICAIANHPALAQTNTTANEQLSKLSVQIKNQLSVLETNKSVEMVRKLEDSVDVLRSFQAGERRQQAKIWFEILAVIDDNMTEASGNYSWAVVPPRDGTNGMQYPAGVTPATLKDPVARSNYEATIRANNEGIQRGNIQVALHKLDKRASESAEMFLKAYYAASVVDKKELGELLAASKLASMRKQHIVKTMNLSQ